jgi:glycosyl transferase, family 25
MNKSIPVFVVSLERSLDRRARMGKILRDADIAHEFISAFDGAKEDAAFVQHAIDQSVFMKKLRGSNLTRGEVGCAMSHIRLYKKIIDENISYACIVEDDIDITDAANFKALTNNEYCKTQKDWDLLLLGHIQQVETPDTSIVSFFKKKATSGIYIAVPVQFCYSTTGYIINNTTARILYEKGLPVRVPADFLTGDSAKYGVRLRAAVPKVIVPNSAYFENEASLVSDGSIRKKGQKTSGVMRSMLYLCLLTARRIGFLRKKKYYDF